MKTAQREEARAELAALEHAYREKAIDAAERLLEGLDLPLAMERAMEPPFADKEDAEARAQEARTAVMEWAKDLIIAGFGLGLDTHRQSIVSPEAKLAERARAVAESLVPRPEATYSGGAMRDQLASIFVIGYRAAQEAYAPTRVGMRTRGRAR